MSIVTFLRKLRAIDDQFTGWRGLPDEYTVPSENEYAIAAHFAREKFDQEILHLAAFDKWSQFDAVTKNGQFVIEVKESGVYTFDHMEHGEIKGLAFPLSKFILMYKAQQLVQISIDDAFIVYQDKTNEIRYLSLNDLKRMMQLVPNEITVCMFKNRPVYSIPLRKWKKLGEE